MEETEDLAELTEKVFSKQLTHFESGILDKDSEDCHFKILYANLCMSTSLFEKVNEMLAENDDEGSLYLALESSNLNTASFGYLNKEKDAYMSFIDEEKQTPPTFCMHILIDKLIFHDLYMEWKMKGSGDYIQGTVNPLSNICHIKIKNDIITRNVATTLPYSLVDMSSASQRHFDPEYTKEIVEALEYLIKVCPIGLIGNFDDEKKVIKVYKRSRINREGSYRPHICLLTISDIPEAMIKKLESLNKMFKGVETGIHITKFIKSIKFNNNVNSVYPYDVFESAAFFRKLGGEAQADQDLGWIDDTVLKINENLIHLTTINLALNNDINQILSDNQLSSYEYRIPKIGKFLPGETVCIGPLKNKKGLYLTIGSLDKGCPDNIKNTVISFRGYCPINLHCHILEGAIVSIFKKDLLLTDAIEVITATVQRKSPVAKTNNVTVYVALKLNDHVYQIGVD